ncbi:Neprilysin [Aphelenchoides avenae]|nr:Neprilysin [Aphelenchus avenae]
MENTPGESSLRKTQSQRMLRSISYGSIGYVVGHELTHGCDDQGASYDKSDNYRNWWDPATYQTFLTRKQCLIDQYSQFQIPEASDRNVDGELTQGENIADNGGLKETYQGYRSTAAGRFSSEFWLDNITAEAYREHVRKLGREEAPLPGLEKYSQDQIFFLAFARTYCTNIRAQMAEQSARRTRIRRDASAYSEHL